MVAPSSILTRTSSKSAEFGCVSTWAGQLDMYVSPIETGMDEFVSVSPSRVIAQAMTIPTCQQDHLLLSKSGELLPYSDFRKVEHRGQLVRANASTVTTGFG